MIGLAAKQQSTLKNDGAYNVTIADANNVHTNTMIVDNSNGKDPATKALLQKLYQGTITSNSYLNSEAEEANYYNADFVVILGQNWDNNSAN